MMDLFHGVRADTPQDDRMALSAERARMLEGAIKATKASRCAVDVVRALMADGAGRSDEEIAALARRPSGRSYAPDTVRHARLALVQAGALKWTGAVRKTSWGGTSYEWVWVW